MFDLATICRSKSKSAGSAATAPQSRTVTFQDLFGIPTREAGPPAESVVVVGNCFSESIVSGMSSLALAARRFGFTAVPLHLRPLDDPENKPALAKATHVFAQNVGALNLDTLRKLVPATAKISRFPDLVFRSAWPFEGANGFRDEVASSLPVGAIHHHDGALARLRALEPDKKKRIQRYRDLDFDWAANIDRIVESQDRFLSSIDENSNVALGRFIKLHFRDKQLFYNSTHPSATVFQQLCSYLWERLGLPGLCPLADGLDSWKDWSIPVHPLLARRLGLRWASESTRYRYHTLGDVTWREWVEAYVEAFG